MKTIDRIEAAIERCVHDARPDRADSKKPQIIGMMAEEIMRAIVAADDDDPRPLAVAKNHLAGGDSPPLRPDVTTELAIAVIALNDELASEKGENRDYCEIYKRILMVFDRIGVPQLPVEDALEQLPVRIRWIAQQWKRLDAQRLELTARSETAELIVATGAGLDKMGETIGLARDGEPDDAYRQRMLDGTYELELTSPEWPRRGLPPQMIRMKFGDRIVRMSTVMAAIKDIAVEKLNGQ